MSDKENYFDYSIPKEIKEKITPIFYQAFFGELISVFGFSLLIPDRSFYHEDKPESAYVDMIGDNFMDTAATAGWHYSFVQTCSKLSMEWLSEYTKELAWYEYDNFCYEITEEMIKYFCTSEYISTNDYYKHLAELHKEED